MYPCGHCEHVTKSHSTRSTVVAPLAFCCITDGRFRILSTGASGARALTAAAADITVATVRRGELPPSRKPLRMSWRGREGPAR